MNVSANESVHGWRGARWRICALLFFATTINYMDRQILGILAPTLQKEIGWSESDYGWIVGVFTFTYAVALLFAGRVLDWVGVRKGFAAAVGSWSLAAAAHAIVSTPFGFGLARAFLGASEAGNFPSALKATAEWFPKKERALATGLFNCGSNIGVIAAAVLVPFVTIHYSWRTAFLVQGALGVVWLLAWLLLYGSPAKLASKEERVYIGADQDETVHVRVPMSQMIRERATWAYACGKMMTDPVWWFFLFWLPKYLNAEHGVSLGTLAAPLIVTYVMADLGSVFGGWLPMRLERARLSHMRARLTAMLVLALGVLPALTLAFARLDVWPAVLLVGLVAAAHQGWSANVFSLPGDLYEPAKVGSVAGFGHFLGSLAAMLFQVAVGYFLQATGDNYAPVFVVCSLAYICAWFVVRRLVVHDRGL